MWATDNSAEIYLNGQDTGVGKDIYGFSSLSTFTITDGFVEGINTLDFQVSNVPPPYDRGNPSGLLVANVDGTFGQGEHTGENVADGGSTLILLGLAVCLIALGARGHRQIAVHT